MQEPCIYTSTWTVLIDKTEKKLSGIVVSGLSIEAIQQDRINLNRVKRDLGMSFDKPLNVVKVTLDKQLNP